MATGYPVIEAQEPAEVREPQLTLELWEARLSDPAFTGNRGVPIHGWAPWIAGFSSAFVHDCIRTYLPRDGKSRTILDPFAGVGTTLVSARLAGHRSVGFEINPYAVLASRAKLEAMSLDVSRLAMTLDRYAGHSENGGKFGHGKAPPEFATRIPFFSPEVERQVYGFLSFLSTISDPAIAALFKLAFGAVMVQFSNYTYEPSLCSRPGAGKALIHDAPVHTMLLNKLRSMTDDVIELQDEVSDSARKAQWQVHALSFVRAGEVLSSDSVDLAVTSPPYMNNYHYVRSTRPQLFWLDLVSSRSELRTLEEENIGKYWQTVRQAKPISLSFDDPEATKLLHELRQTRAQRGPYGGPGWANYVASYFNDTYRFLEVLRAVLAPDGTAVIVIGNSIIQGHEFKVDKFLVKIAQRLGMDYVNTIELRNKRVGASITKSTVRRGSESNARLYECAIVLRKGQG
jgi:DNA modification methylase